MGARARGLGSMVLVVGLVRVWVVVVAILRVGGNVMVGGGAGVGGCVPEVVGLGDEMLAYGLSVWE